jgi:hypothetical protein
MLHDPNQGSKTCTSRKCESCLLMFLHFVTASNVFAIFGAILISQRLNVVSIMHL